MYIAESVSVQDWVSLCVGVLGFLAAYLGRQDRLPSWARLWLKRIGTEKIIDAIEHAAAVIEMTPEERRRQAVIYLQRVCVKELGFVVPDSIANLLVEYIYQQWKRARKQS